MRILIFSWRGPKHPNAGGAEISTHEHAKGWVKAGHRVTIFTSSYKEAKKEEYLDGIHIIRKSSQVLGVHIAAIKWYFFDRKENFDIVIDQFHGIPFFTPLYVKTRKLAFIHEVTKEVWKFNPWLWPFNHAVSLVGQIFEPLIFKLFYKEIPFITVSESTKKDLIYWSIPKNNTTVIHNGVTNPKYAKLTLKEKTKTGIYLGAISRDKGIEDAIKIFVQVLKKENDWQFWIVGKAEIKYLNKLKNIIQKFGVTRQVKFLGFVSDKEKYNLLSRAHILINPSIREGWSLVVMEAASVGTPTVGYDVPGLRDSIVNNKTGIICKPTIASCTKALLTLMADSKKYQTLRCNCVSWSKKFKWCDASKQSLKLIQNLNDAI